MPEVELGVTGVIRFPVGEEGKRRRKLAIVMLLICIPYPMWAGWAAATHRLPSPRLLPIIFVLNFALIFAIFTLYKKHLYRHKDD